MDQQVSWLESFLVTQLHTGMRAARIVSLGVFDVLLSVGPPTCAYIALGRLLNLWSDIILVILSEQTHIYQFLGHTPFLHTPSAKE